jgi:hypothetical protein
MSSLPLPSAPEEITAEWLTAALRERVPEIAVERVEIVQIIPGTATKIRVRASYGDGHDWFPPETLCIKGGFDKRLYRKAATALVKRLHLMDTARAYQLEAAFYNDLAPAVKAPLPRCWFAGSDSASGQGIVVLDDLTAAGVSFGDPTRPWSVDRVAAALEVQAAWHAATWQRSRDAYRWLPPASIIGELTPILLSSIHWNTHFRHPRSPSLPPPLNDRRRVRAALAQMWRRHASEAICLTHGDAHLGNAYVDQHGQPTFFDWQAVCFGPPLDDVAYFVTGALQTADRRAHERDLLRHYLAALTSQGIEAPTEEEAWRAYRCYSLHGILWAVTPPMMQSRNNVRAMAERHVAAILDLDALQAVSD